MEPAVLKLDPPKATRHKRVDPRPILNGIIFRLRSGCQCDLLPKEFGDDSTVRRTFRRWVELGVLSRIWGMMENACGELGGVDWEWQSADGAMGKAWSGGTWWAGTPRIGRKQAPGRVSS